MADIIVIILIAILIFFLIAEFFGRSKHIGRWWSFTLLLCGFIPGLIAILSSPSANKKPTSGGNSYKIGGYVCLFFSGLNLLALISTSGKLGQLFPVFLVSGIYLLQLSKGLIINHKPKYYFQKTKKHIKIKSDVILNDNENFNFKINKSIVKKIAFIVSSLIIGFVSYKTFLIFNLSEKEVENTSNRFFAMLSIENPNYEEIEKIYPNFRKIGERLVLTNSYEIKNISKNSDGDFEVYTNYKINNFQTKQIFLIIGKVGGNTIIKSSKGLNYAYFDKTFEYGKKKGVLTGNEDDIEMGEKIKSKRVKEELDVLTDIFYSTLTKNMKLNNSLSYNYGYINGDITITNNNNIDLESYEIDCKIFFYDHYGELIKTTKVYFINGIKANSNESEKVFTTLENTAETEIKFTVISKKTVANKIKEEIIN